MATSLRLGAGCRGHTTSLPDAIVRLTGTAPLLRVSVSSSFDTTLLISDPGGRFHCNDDVVPGRDTSPRVDLYAPREGQYDIWVGTQNPGERGDAELLITAHRAPRQ